MAETLRTVLNADGDQRLQTRELLTGSVAILVTAGVSAGTIRPDIAAADVLLSVAGVTLIAGAPDQRDLAGCLLDLLMDGLTCRSNPV